MLQNNKMKKKDILTIVFLVLLILTLPLAVILVKQRWLPKKAAVLHSPIMFTPTAGEFPVGQSFTVSLMLNTENRSVDGLDLVITVHNLEMTVEKRTLPENLVWQKEPEVFRGILKFSILALPGQPFANNVPLPLVNLNLRGRVSCQNATLITDKNLSVVASSGQNILGEPGIPKFTIQTPAGITNPTFTSSATVSAILNQDFTYTATATNPNNGVLDFRFYHLPDFLTASGPNLSGKPDRTGDFTIDMETTDGKGGSACATLNLTVLDPTPTPTPTPILPTPTIPAGKSLNIKFQFQGKKENQNNHPLTIWIKETGFKKTFTGNTNGTYSFNIKGELANRERPYEVLLKGYQNLAVKRALAIHDGPNPAQGWLDFGQLPCGDIAPRDNPDDMINSLDWGYMVDQWNIDQDKESVADINDDSRVNSLDYSLMVSRFGQKGDE
jgi:hypothetical protein